MKRCSYCNTIHIEEQCILHTNEDVMVYAEVLTIEPTYNTRLQFGFQLLSQDDDGIKDKFGNVKSSGNY